MLDLVALYALAQSTLTTPLILCYMLQTNINLTTLEPRPLSTASSPLHAFYVPERLSLVSEDNTRSGLDLLPSSPLVLPSPKLLAT